MELSCRLDGHSVHMLAYGLATAGGLRTRRGMRRDRGRPARPRPATWWTGCASWGSDITWPQVEALADGGVVGRPHVARAMVAAGAIARPEQAFTPEWIGAGGRAYVSRYALDPVRAIGLIAEAGGAAVLAHPGAVSRGWKLPDETISGWPVPGWPAWRSGIPIMIKLNDRASVPWPPAWTWFPPEAATTTAA